MILENYILFVTIAILYIASPGPAVFLAINYGALYGFKRVFITLLGNSTGLAILAFLSAIGIGAIIVNSIFLTNIIKILGAIFLVYICIKMILSYYKNKDKSKNSQNIDDVISNQNNLSSYKEGLFLALSNPKPIIFFTSIYPQFIVNSGDGIIKQFFIMGFTFTFLSLLCLSLYAILSLSVFKKFLSVKRVILLNLFSGVTFIILAFFLIIN